MRCLKCRWDHSPLDVFHRPQEDVSFLPCDDSLVLHVDERQHIDHVVGRDAAQVEVAELFPVDRPLEQRVANIVEPRIVGVKLRQQRYIKQREDRPNEELRMFPIVRCLGDDGDSCVGRGRVHQDDAGLSLQHDDGQIEIRRHVDLPQVEEHQREVEGRAVQHVVGEELVIVEKKVRRVVEIIADADVVGRDARIQQRHGGIFDEAVNLRAQELQHLRSVRDGAEVCVDVLGKRQKLRALTELLVEPLQVLLRHNVVSGQRRKDRHLTAGQHEEAPQGCPIEFLRRQLVDVQVLGGEVAPLAGEDQKVGVVGENGKDAGICASEARQLLIALQVHRVVELAVHSARSFDGAKQRVGVAVERSSNALQRLFLVNLIHDFDAFVVLSLLTARPRREFIGLDESIEEENELACARQSSEKSVENLCANLMTAATEGRDFIATEHRHERHHIEHQNRRFSFISAEIRIKFREFFFISFSYFLNCSISATMDTNLMAGFGQVLRKVSSSVTPILQDKLKN